MSSAIPKARFSKGVEAPAAEARRHSPSDSTPAPIDEYLSLPTVFFKYHFIPIYNKVRKGMEIYPISTENAKSLSLGTK